jgi:outer membrane protein TolC
MQQMFSSFNPRFARLPAVVLLGSLVMLGGCSITPKPTSASEIQARVVEDQLAMFSAQEPLSQPVSLDEATARALKYNLDHRLKLMESALSTGLADLSRYEMLPSLLVSAGYTKRSNDSGGNSVDIETGQVSLSNSTSEERQHTLSRAEFSWNLLDFGVSYYRAKQQANQVLIAEERRQRVTQNIVQDVRSAYWRALGAQRLESQAQELGQRVEAALTRSREAERQGLVSPKDALGFQRMLLDAQLLLAERRQGLAYAKLELAALMNLAPGTPFSLADTRETALPQLPADLKTLDELALSHRPELREEDYRARISADEARRQLLGLMPGLTLSTGINHDTNKYLFNQSWNQSGVQLGMNLLRLLSLPTLQHSQEAQEKLDQARRLALTMAILTQNRVAAERYRLALEELQIARNSSDVDQRLADFAQAAVASKTDSELELIRAQTRVLNSKYQEYAAYASAQAAYGRVYNSLGLSVLPEDTGGDLQQLGQAVSAKLAGLESALSSDALALEEEEQ